MHLTTSSNKIQFYLQILTFGLTEYLFGSLKKTQ